jgi:hypothetical protein
MVVRFLGWLFRTAFVAAWKAAFFLLAVIPGYGLMLVHTTVVRLAGRQEHLLPTFVYRLIGFGLTMAGVVALLVIASLISQVTQPR